MGAFIRRTRGVMVIAATFAVVAFVFLSMRVTGPAIATSGGDPYVTPEVVDTNPDPTIVETTITAQGAVVDIGNGVNASVLTFNGSIPGPTFRLHINDTVIVHFKNMLGHPSGIHWHGIELANSSDGTPLTQNMVPNGGEYLYKFKVTRPGIYWYHPHHHSSTNQVFKGLYGAIVITDPNEAALQASGALPPVSATRTFVLSDITVCKTPGTGENATRTFPEDAPWLNGVEGDLPDQPGPPRMPDDICELSPLDEDGNARPAFLNGDVPNIQPGGSSGAVSEGQTVLTNGINVGGRAGAPSSPGLLDAGAHTLDVQAGQGFRMQIVNTATVRFFRLRLTDSTGAQVQLFRVGGQGGLLDEARLEGGVVSGFDWRYASGEILLDAGERADVVFAVPPAATGVLTLWTEDFERVGPSGRFTGLPSVPVAHFNVNGTASSPYTIAAGTDLRFATGDPQVALGAATGTLLDPGTFSPVKNGMPSQDIQLTNAGNILGINGVQGAHDPGEPYASAAHAGSTRYAKLGDTLELTVTNVTGAHHPFHLHGFSIQPKSLTKASSPTYTFAYNEYVDNIDVPGGYTLTFRIKLEDRPLQDGLTPGGGLGRWVFHCHIFFHATFGMLSEFDVVAANGNERPYIDANETHVDGNSGDSLTMHGTYSDPDGDAVTLTASAGSVTDDGGGNWTWTGSAASSQYVYVTAADPGGRNSQATFQLKINQPPVLTVPGPQEADYHDELSFGVSATDPDGDPITLGVAGLPASLSFTDHGNGTGSVSGLLTVAPGVYVATFSASDGHNPTVHQDVQITVTKEETTLTYTGPTVILNGGNATLSALLTEDTPTPVEGRIVDFTLGAQSCSGTTLATGVASCTIAVNSPLGASIPITAAFAGDTFYLPSSASATAVVFAFPAGGAFVVGDTSAAAGGAVTWWSNSWSKVNILSGGEGPSAMKGFAAGAPLPTSTPPPSCGGLWTTSSGSSPPPPAGIPSFMGVLASSSVVKSGTATNGNTVSIIVVQVNPGYAPNSGNDGTGTVVAAFCHQ